MAKLNRQILSGTLKYDKLASLIVNQFLIFPWQRKIKFNAKQILNSDETLEVASNLASRESNIVSIELTERGKRLYQNRRNSLTSSEDIWQYRIKRLRGLWAIFVLHDFVILRQAPFTFIVKIATCDRSRFFRSQWEEEKQ